MSAPAALTSPVDLTLAELRRHAQAMPLLPYEKLLGASSTAAVGQAERVLSEGWRLGTTAALDLAGPFPWDEFEPKDRSWNFHLNCWDPLEDLLAAYSSTADDKYLSTVVRVACDWIAGHQNLGAGGEHAWYDMACGVRAYRLAYTLDASLRAAWVSDADVQLMRQSLETHRQELSDDAKIAFHNNHGFYQVAGQLAMARRFGALSPSMHASLEQAQARLLRMIDQQFSDEGVHREHSPDYHRMVYETLKGIADAGLLADPTIEQRLDEIERSLSWFILPNGYLANFGDSDYRLCSRGERAALAKWRTPEMRFATTNGQIGERHRERARAFPGSGYFVVHDATGRENPADASYLALAAAFHSRTHKHADDLSFIWYDRSSPILVDAGRYGYDAKTEVGSELWSDGFWYSDPNRVYCESTRAHNTVEIDDRNYVRKGAKPFGSALKRCGVVGSDLYYAEAEVKQFKSVRHVRLLFYRPQAWLVVYDWLHDNLDAEHQYRQWLHLAPELSVEQIGEQYRATYSRWEKPLCIGSLLPTIGVAKPILGRESPSRQGWWSPKARMILPNYALAFEARARSTVFATVLAFCDQLSVDASSRVSPSGRSGLLRFRTDGVEQVLSFSRPEAGEIEVGCRSEDSQEEGTCASSSRGS